MTQPDRTDRDPDVLLSDAESKAVRATRAVSILGNLISAPFYANTQIPFGISLPEWRTLRHVHDCPGITQTEIADETAQHIMTLSRSVRQLTRKRLVEGRVDPADRRRTQLFPTELGEEMATEMKRREAIQVRHIMDGIDDDEIDELVRIIDKLIGYVRTTDRPPPPPASRDWRGIVESTSRR